MCILLQAVYTTKCTKNVCTLSEFLATDPEIPVSIPGVTIFWPLLWSSGQSSWLQIQRSGFNSRRYQIF
jgi:hypothetical protein